MKIEHNRMLDALCGEYILGSLRGAARRRFERALREEPLVASRLADWQRMLLPRHGTQMEIKPASHIWNRLERELSLARYRTRFFRRISFWRGWAAAATVGLVAAIGINVLEVEPQAQPMREIARLEGTEITPVSAQLMRDGHTLQLHALQPTHAGPAQSYELWLLPAEGGAISLAVLVSLDAHFVLPPGQVERLHKGAKLAVTLEPAGGSPTGKATGPVILIGEVKL
jgi:anti-sigma-K factor RskA